MSMFLVVLGLVTLFVFKRIFVYFGSPVVDLSISRRWCLFSPISLFGSLSPTSWWNPGLRYTWVKRDHLYKSFPHRIFTLSPYLSGRTVVYCGSVEGLKQITSPSGAFAKPALALQDVNVLGTNVLSSEGEDWKRHRRIVAPAFNQTTYRNVWEATVNVYKDIVDKERWEGKESVTVDNFSFITHKLALFIISICGFGINMPWNFPKRDAEGRLSLQEAIFEVATTIIIRSRTPKFFYSLPLPKLKLVDEAYNYFVEFMQKRIASREIELNQRRELDGDVTDGIRDVFGRLVNARLTEGKLSLSETEIIGNCFIFAFAGHETTAHTLSTTLALLALYPETQKWIQDSIDKTLGDHEPAFEDYDALDDVLSCFKETLRLFPPAYMIVREAMSDTTLSLSRQDGSGREDIIAMPKGTQVIVDFIGMGYDTMTFPDPEAYDPTRWSNNAPGSNPRQAKLNRGEDELYAFSLGGRTCIGRKFATVEAVAFLTHLLRDWSVETVMREGETVQEWRDRVLDPKMLISLNFEGDVPLRLKKRTRGAAVDAAA